MSVFGFVSRITWLSPLDLTFPRYFHSEDGSISSLSFYITICLFFYLYFISYFIWIYLLPAGDDKACCPAEIQNSSGSLQNCLNNFRSLRCHSKNK